MSQETLCGRCHLPIHPQESGVEYHGFYTTHVASRCVELLNLQHQAEVEQLRQSLGKINEIRNSIIGYQNFSISAHGYPLVAALEEAGFKGEGYEEASAKAQTQVDLIASLRQRCEALEAALRWADEHLIALNVLRDIAGNRVEIVSRKDVAVHKNIESYGRTVLEALQAGQMDMESK